MMAYVHTYYNNCADPRTCVNWRDRVISKKKLVAFDELQINL